MNAFFFARKIDEALGIFLSYKLNKILPGDENKFFNWCNS